jgi:hypothetical protein
MPSRRPASRRTWSPAFLRPWLVAAAAGLVLGALLLSLDSGEASGPFVDFGRGEDTTQPFHPTEAMLSRAETEFRDAFAPPAPILGAEPASALSSFVAAGESVAEAGLTPPRVSARAETPGSAR